MYSYNYPRAALTVDAVVAAREGGIIRILLIRRKNMPFIHQWALPGGFINMDETLAVACKRELFEETGLELDNLMFLGIYDAPGRDPRGRTISVVFYQVIENCPVILAGDDAENAGWFPAEELPVLAFDHDRIVGDFLKSRALT